MQKKQNGKRKRRKGEKRETTRETPGTEELYNEVIIHRNSAAQITREELWGGVMGMIPCEI